MLRFALLGCGKIAKRHSELLGSGQIRGAVLGPVCDVIPEKAKAIAESFNVPHYEDMDTLMQHEEVDATIVATPGGFHADNVVALARYGKPIIVEKPMALTLDDADRMIRICDQNGVRLFVVKQNRFNVPVQKLWEVLQAGRFGKLVLGTVRVRWCRTQEYYDQDAWRGTWACDGGVLTNQASHHIDLLEWMMGEVESVFAKSATALVDIEVEDTAVVVLRFRSGALGIIEATTATRPKDLEGSLSILGEKGAVEIGGFSANQMKVWQFADAHNDDESVMERFSSNPPLISGYGHKAYLEHVADCLQHGGKALVDGLEGRKSLELIMAIYESIETGQEVYLRFTPKKCRLGVNR